MGTAPAFASVGEAIEMARAALGYLAAGRLRSWEVSVPAYLAGRRDSYAWSAS